MKTFNIEYAFAWDIGSVKEWNELGTVEAENEEEAVIKAMEEKEEEEDKKTILKEIRKKGLKMTLFRVSDVNDEEGNYHIIFMGD